jgi:hypothetical protein
VLSNCNIRSLHRGVLGGFIKSRNGSHSEKPLHSTADASHMGIFSGLQDLLIYPLVTTSLGDTSSERQVQGIRDSRPRTVAELQRNLRSTVQQCITQG